jgi:uncharacterized coiled-coil protein SlyX
MKSFKEFLKENQQNSNNLLEYWVDPEVRADRRALDAAASQIDSLQDKIKDLQNQVERSRATTPPNPLLIKRLNQQIAIAQSKIDQVKTEAGKIKDRMQNRAREDDFRRRVGEKTKNDRLDRLVATGAAKLVGTTTSVVKDVGRRIGQGLRYLGRRAISKISNKSASKLTS